MRLLAKPRVSQPRSWNSEKDLASCLSRSNVVSWLKQGLAVRSAHAAVEAWSMFGGVPRYWELARDFASLPRAFHALVLDPLGILHGEPQRWVHLGWQPRQPGFLELEQLEPGSRGHRQRLQ